MKIYNLPQKPTCLIFDIDSTLYTNEKYATDQILVQIKHFAKIFAMSQEDAEESITVFRAEYAKLHGKKISLGNTLEHFGVPISESIRWRETLIQPEDYLTEDIFLIKTLDALSSRFSFIALTNNPVLVAKKALKALGVLHYFSHIVGLDTTGFSKPHEQPLKLCLEVMNVNAEQCISIGDRFDIDLALPLEMGMGGILVDGVGDVYKLIDVLENPLP